MIHEISLRPKIYQSTWDALCEILQYFRCICHFISFYVLNRFFYDYCFSTVENLINCHTNHLRVSYSWPLPIFNLSILFSFCQAFVHRFYWLFAAQGIKSSPIDILEGVKPPKAQGKSKSPSPIVFYGLSWMTWNWINNRLISYSTIALGIRPTAWG